MNKKIIGGAPCNLKGKKVLVLGAAHQHCKIIKAAQELGAYVIVTDYLENSPGKKIADKLPVGKTVIRIFLGTGMISVMPVLLLTVHPQGYSL